MKLISFPERKPEQTDAEREMALDKKMRKDVVRFLFSGDRTRPIAGYVIVAVHRDGGASFMYDSDGVILLLGGALSNVEAVLHSTMMLSMENSGPINEEGD